MSETVVTIGNFDGCHVGHQALIAKAFEISKSYQLDPLVYTFDPHPQEFFCGASLPRLFSVTQKSQAMHEMGITQVVTQQFDQSFSQISHQEFYEMFLKQRLAAKALVVGEDFRFGHKRLGDVEYLRARSLQEGMVFVALAPKSLEGQVVSSSRIRTAITSDGDMVLAAQMLSRPYALQGVIAKGKQQGRLLSFPTANLSNIQQLIPKVGVYAGYASLEPQATLMTQPENLIPMVVNIGYRPTIAQERELTVESHFFAGQFPLDSLYGQKLTLYFIKRLRDEVVFASKDQLVDQIGRDIESAQKILKDG